MKTHIISDNGNKKPWTIKMLSWLMLLILAAIVVGQFLLPNEKKKSEEAELLYKGSFVQVKPDGTLLQINVPTKLDVKKGETLVLETILGGKIENGDYFAYNSTHQSVHVYLKIPGSFGTDIKGDEIFSYDTTASPFFGNNTASGYVFVPMNQAMSGMVLRLEITSTDGYRKNAGICYYGNKGDIWALIAKERALGLVVAAVLTVVGISIIVVSELVRLKVFKRVIPISYLGWGAFACGLYILCESRYRQLVFLNYSVVANMAFILLLLTPAADILFINNVQKSRYRNIHTITFGIVMLTIIVLTILHLTKVADFLQTMFVNYLVCYGAVAEMFITVIIDYRKNRASEYKLLVAGFTAQAIFSALEIVLDAKGLNIHTGIYLGIGSLIYVLLAAYNTASLMLEEEEEKRKAVAEGEAKSMFLANMSHEIRTPINAVLGMNEMILRDSKEPSTREYAKNIEASGHLLLSLINDILDYSKIESDKLEIIPASYKVSGLVKELENTFRPKAENKNLDFYVNVDPVVPEHLYGDEVRISQIAINLINNAIKYTEKGSVTLNISGRRSDKETFNLRLDVIDTGKGIKNTDKGVLFEAFKRVDEKKNKNIEGTGLGLSITSSLINMMQGEIIVDSVYGMGSTFTAIVPQKIEDEEEIGNFKERIENEHEEVKEYKESFTAPDARVLVVDDNRTNLTVIRLLLRDTKIILTPVDSGQKAIDMVKENSYDLILLDHMMPEMDGMETLAKLREEMPELNIPIIALTANAVPGSKEMYLSAGFSDYLSKPVSGDMLEAMLRKWLPSRLIKS